MRTITAAELQKLRGLSGSYAGGTHVSIVVCNPQNEESQVGIDEFFLSLSITNSIDAEVETCEIQLVKKIYEFDLNPQNPTSFYNTAFGPDVPLLDLYRRIKVFVAVAPHLASPDDSDYKIIFDGRIDAIDYTDSTRIVLQLRDLGGTLLQDRFVEGENTYFGAADGPEVNFEVLLVRLLNEYVPDVVLWSKNGTVADTFNTPVDNPGTYQSRVLEANYKPVMTLVNEYLSAIGWDARMRYTAQTDGYVYMAKETDRQATTSLQDMYPGQDYVAVNDASLNITMMRNVVQIAYWSKANKVEIVEARDNTSITRYGRRWMLIQEGKGSLINTQTEAQKMADDILHDLKNPYITHAITVPYVMWHVELNDLIKFKADNIYFHDDTSLAVVEYTFEIDKDGARTKLGTRGKPAGKFYNWSRREQTYSDLVVGLRITDTTTNTVARLGNGDFLQYSRG